MQGIRVFLDNEEEDVEGGEGHQEDGDAREVPSSSTAGKQVNRKLAQSAINLTHLLFAYFFFSKLLYLGS
jgi:hypothetical protein